MDRVDRLAVVVPAELEMHRLRGVVAEDLVELGVVDRRTEEERGAQGVVRGLAVFFDRSKPHDDVGACPLGMDELDGLGLTLLEILADLVLGVPPLLGVAGQFQAMRISSGGSR